LGGAESVPRPPEALNAERARGGSRGGCWKDRPRAPGGWACCVLDGFFFPGPVFAGVIFPGPRNPRPRAYKSVPAQILKG